MTLTNVLIKKLVSERIDELESELAAYRNFLAPPSVRQKRKQILKSVTRKKHRRGGTRARVTAFLTDHPGATLREIEAGVGVVKGSTHLRFNILRSIATEQDGRYTIKAGD